MARRVVSIIAIVGCVFLGSALHSSLGWADDPDIMSPPPAVIDESQPGSGNVQERSVPGDGEPRLVVIHCGSRAAAKLDWQNGIGGSLEENGKMESIGLNRFSGGGEVSGVYNTVRQEGPRIICSYRASGGYADYSWYASFPWAILSCTPFPSAFSIKCTLKKLQIPNVPQPDIPHF